MKNKWMLIGCILALPLTAFAKKGGREGHGGDFYIGSDFYTIAERLEKMPEVETYEIGKLLDQGLSILPESNLLKLTIDGIPHEVDAISEVTKEGPQTRVVRSTWGYLSCAKKYHLVLHELFVLLGVEGSLSYSVSSPIMEKISNRMDCSRIGDDAARIRVQKFRDAMVQTLDSIKPILELKQVNENTPFGYYLTSRPYGRHSAGPFGIDHILLLLSESRIGDELMACLSTDAAPVYSLRLGRFGYTPVFEDIFGVKIYPTQIQNNTYSKKTTPLSFARLVERHCYAEGNLTVERLRSVQIARALMDAINLNSTKIRNSSYVNYSHKLKRYRMHSVSGFISDLKTALVKRTQGDCQVSEFDLKQSYENADWESLEQYEVASRIDELCKGSESK